MVGLARPVQVKARQIAIQTAENDRLFDWFGRFCNAQKY